MSPRSSTPYFLASVVLLVVLVALYAASSARRTQAELQEQLEQKGQALANALEASSQNAIRSNTLVEEMIAQRLLDNARLINELLRRPLDPAELSRIVEHNRLRRVDLLDPDGRPWIPPPSPPVMMRPMTGGRGAESSSALGPQMPMMRYMWGRRWGRPGEGRDEAGGAPAAIRDRKFWEGSVFGVAIGATSFRGIIAVHADVDYILNFRREIGVERQIENLARQSGVSAVGLLGPDLTVLAHSDAGRVGQRRAEPALAETLSRGRSVSRFLDAPGGRVLEVARPLTLDEGRIGLLTIDFSTEPMQRAWRRDLRSGLLLGAAVLAVGALGMALIFYAQQRHLREVRALEVEMGRRERLVALGDVAAAFAHEVRNPLNAVSMGLQRLGAEFRPEPAEAYARFVDLMQGEVRRLNAIVEQFIALARPLPLKPDRFPLEELLRELVALVEAEAAQAGVTVRLIPPSSLPPLVADRDHLKQVLLNLMLNAVQAMTTGGTLTLSADAARDRLTLTVADNGPGIAADVLPRIFDPYFTTKPGGLGLGLTIARRIVEAHGGALTVDSDGRGTRFHVSLPVGPG